LPHRACPTISHATRAARKLLAEQTGKLHAGHSPILDGIIALDTALESQAQQIKILWLDLNELFIAES
jgi:hypothetical protein